MCLSLCGIIFIIFFVAFRVWRVAATNVVEIAINKIKYYWSRIVIISSTYRICFMVLFLVNIACVDKVRLILPENRKCVYAVALRRRYLGECRCFKDNLCPQGEAITWLMALLGKLFHILYTFSASYWNILHW